MGWWGRRWVYLAAGVFAVAALLTLAFVNGLWSYPLDASQRGGPLYEYQSLIAGLLALAGAILTVVFLHRQISATVTSAERERRVGVSTRNRPLIAELGELIAALDRQARSVRWNFGTITIEKLTIGPELEQLSVISSERSKVYRALRLLSARLHRRYRPGEDSERWSLLQSRRVGYSQRMTFSAIQNLRQVSASVARLLEQGWEVVELRAYDSDELSRLGSPPT